MFSPARILWLPFLPCWLYFGRVSSCFFVHQIPCPGLDMWSDTIASNSNTMQLKAHMVDRHCILVRKDTSNLTLTAQLARLPLLVWALMGDLILNLHGEEAGHIIFIEFLTWRHSTAYPGRTWSLNQRNTMNKFRVSLVLLTALSGDKEVSRGPSVAKPRMSGDVL